MKKLKEYEKLLPRGSFKLKSVVNKGITFYELSKLVEVGLVEKLGRGIYQKKSSNKEDVSFDTKVFKKISTAVGEPNCICLWSALSFYDLTEEFIDEQVWLYVPYSKTSRRKQAKLVRQSNPNWEIGIIQKEGFKITSIERTLIECLKDKRHVPLKDALGFCKEALQLKKTTWAKLVKMAKELEVYSKVEEKMELIS